MSKHQVSSEVPPYLVSTYAPIQRAFPHRVPDQSYWPLLSILGEEMSDRSVAQVVSLVTGREYVDVLHDLLRVHSTAAPRAEEINGVKERLLACGYEDWLAEPA